jgi:hypothetical protein
MGKVKGGRWDWGNAKCGMRSAECGVRNKKRREATGNRIKLIAIFTQHSADIRQRAFSRLGTLIRLIITQGGVGYET